MYPKNPFKITCVTNEKFCILCLQIFRLFGCCPFKLSYHTSNTVYEGDENSVSIRKDEVVAVSLRNSKVMRIFSVVMLLIYICTTTVQLTAEIYLSQLSDFPLTEIEQATNIFVSLSSYAFILFALLYTSMKASSFQKVLNCQKNILLKQEIFRSTKVFVTSWPLIFIIHILIVIFLDVGYILHILDIQTHLPDLTVCIYIGDLIKKNILVVFFITVCGMTCSLNTTLSCCFINLKKPVLYAETLLESDEITEIINFSDVFNPYSYFNERFMKNAEESKSVEKYMKPISSMNVFSKCERKSMKVSDQMVNFLDAPYNSNMCSRHHSCENSLPTDNMRSADFSSNSPKSNGSLYCGAAEYEFVSELFKYQLLLNEFFGIPMTALTAFTVIMTIYFLFFTLIFGAGAVRAIGTTCWAVVCVSPLVFVYCQADKVQEEVSYFQCFYLILFYYY